MEKIQKGMRVFQILSKIIFVFACVGVALTSIAATLVATGMLNMENQLQWLSVTVRNWRKIIRNSRTENDIYIIKEPDE